MMLVVLHFLFNALWMGLSHGLFPELNRFIPGVSLSDGALYDYIVVGAGAAGAAAASRLALAGADVLLIEAGGDQNLISLIPRASMLLWGSDLDWDYKTIPNNKSCLASRGRQCRYTSGKCLGGSTSIHSMMYTRGNRVDFDNMGIPRWKWKDVEPYFLKYEGLRDLHRLPRSSTPFHNTKGIMDIEYFGESGIPWHENMLDGFKELNFSYNPDVNARSQIGTSQVLGYVYQGIRMSTARAYLSKTHISKKLKISKNTQCTGVIIDNDNVAHGVTVVTGTSNQNIKVYARREVILSAGAIGTPKLLMLSGIGPADHLTRMGVPLRADLPVGNNLRDHIFPLLFILVDFGFGLDLPNLAVLASKGYEAAEWLLTQTGPLAANGLTDVSAFFNINCYDFKLRRLDHNKPNCEIPTSQLYNTYIDRNLVQGVGPIVQNAVNLNDEVFKQIEKANIHSAIMISTLVLLEPHSHGTVRLASTNPSEPPNIFPNFLSNEQDVVQMLKSITVIKHLTETDVFKKHNATLMTPVISGCPSIKSDEEGYWYCYCRYLTYLVFHPVGTAALGPVLDESLRVRGVKRLRVADASALPTPLHGNPAAAVTAIGERVAAFILDDQT